jgi:hypothetical protein
VIKKKREEALWKPGLFYGVSTRVKMTNQATLHYIEDEWGVSFEEILADESD